MKKWVILIFITFVILTASGYDYRYEVAVDSLPPRMRGFGDEHYFQTFIKPKQRDSLNVRCVGRWPFGLGFEVYGNANTNILCFGAGSGVSGL